MQIGGLGGNHSTGDHHVTNCMHDHHEVQKNTGGMTMKSSAAMEAQRSASELQQGNLYSLAAWLKNTLGSGRGFLLNFRGDGQTSAEGAESGRTIVSGTENGQSVSRAVNHTENVTAVSAAVPVLPDTQPGVIDNMRYASGQTFWQKMRGRFQHVSEHLKDKSSRKFSGFQTRNSFQARHEPPREDPRKPGRCRRDTVELDCALVEDNYLMDSYDRKGGYTRLTTRK